MTEIDYCRIIKRNRLIDLAKLFIHFLEKNYYKENLNSDKI